MPFKSQSTEAGAGGQIPAIIVEESDSALGFFSLFLDQAIDQYEKDMMVINWKSPSYQIPAKAKAFSSKGGIRLTEIQFKDSLVDEARKRCALLLASHDITSEHVDISELNGLRCQGVDMAPSLISEICRFYPDTFISERCSLILLQNIITARIYTRMILDQLLSQFDVRGLFLTEWTYRIQDLVQYAVNKNICVPQYLEGIPFCHLQEANISTNGLYSPKSGYGYAIARQASIVKKRSEPQAELLFRSTMTERARSSTHVHRTKDAVLDKSRRFLRAEFSQYESISEQPTSAVKDSQHNVVLYLHAVTDGLFNYGYDGYSSPYHYFEDVACSIADIFGRQCNIIVKAHPNLFHKDDSAYPSAQDLSAQEGTVTKVLLARLLQKIEKYGCGLYLLDPNISVYQWTRRVCPNAVHVTQFGKVSLETLWLGQRTIYSEMAPYAGIGVGGWTWQSLRKSPDKLCKIFSDHHTISLPLLSEYVLTSAQELDIHYPKRSWISFISDRLRVPKDSLSYLLSYSETKERLREAARKTPEFDFVMNNYVLPVIAALYTRGPVAYPIVK